MVVSTLLDAGEAVFNCYTGNYLACVDDIVDTVCDLVDDAEGGNSTFVQYTNYVKELASDIT